MLTLLLLILVANGSPVIARKVLGKRFDYPLDSGRILKDGQPLLGHSKTLRGIVSSILLTTITAVLLGLNWYLGLVVSITAMTGDLCSSFIKRRLKRPVSSQFIGLDHIPESLFPLLVYKTQLSLSVTDIVLIVIAFELGALILSRILFLLNIRRRPY